MSKPFYKSSTFYWACITALLGLYGNGDSSMPFMSMEWSHEIVGALTALSAIFTIYGRSQAEGPTTLT